MGINCFVFHANFSYHLFAFNITLIDQKGHILIVYVMNDLTKLEPK